MSLPPCFISGFTAYGLSYYTILGLHLNDCSKFDHCNRWIFDAAIDLAKTSAWGGAISEVWGKSPSKKRAWIKPCEWRYGISS